MEERHQIVELVEIIDHDTQIIPKGSFIMSEPFKIVPDSSFCGLNDIESSNLNNYYHFHASKHQLRSNLLGQEGVTDVCKFLDPILEDDPKGLWCTTFNQSISTTYIRNLTWPGFHYFGVDNKNIYGSCYFGYGKKENDVVFMI